MPTLGPSNLICVAGDTRIPNSRRSESVTHFKKTSEACLVVFQSQIKRHPSYTKRVMILPSLDYIWPLHGQSENNLCYMERLVFNIFISILCSKFFLIVMLVVFLHWSQYNLLIVIVLLNHNNHRISVRNLLDSEEKWSTNAISHASEVRGAYMHSF